MSMPLPAHTKLLLDAVNKDGAETVWRRLDAAEIQAFHWDLQTGQRRPIDPQQWRKMVTIHDKDGKAIQRSPVDLLEAGDLSWLRDELGQRIAENPVLLPHMTVDEFVDHFGLRKTQPEATPPIKNKGGHPGKWDWEGAYIEMARADIAENPTRPRMQEIVAQWFTDNFDDQPSEGMIRAKVKRFYDTIYPATKT